MKFRLDTKTVKGKPRWYIVRSEYVKATRKRRPVWVYLGWPPSDKMRKLVAKLKTDDRNDPIWQRIFEENKKSKAKARLQGSKTFRLPRNHWSDFVSGMAGLRNQIDELFRDDPPEKWPIEKRLKFLKATEWIEVETEKAKKLLKS
jgi:hypothetical protein